MFEDGDAAGMDVGKGIEMGIDAGIDGGAALGGPKPGGGEEGPRDDAGGESSRGVCSIPPSSDPVRSPSNGCGFSHA